MGLECTGLAVIRCTQAAIGSEPTAGALKFCDATCRIQSHEVGYFFLSMHTPKESKKFDSCYTAPLHLPATDFCLLEELSWRAHLGLPASSVYPQYVAATFAKFRYPHAHVLNRVWSCGCSRLRVDEAVFL